MDMFVLYDWIILSCLLAALGLFSGFLAGLLGIGGGVVLVPGLYFLFSYLGFDSSVLMHVAVGSSLAIIVPTGLSSVNAHMKRGCVDFNLFKNIGSGIFIGAILGALWAGTLSTESLKIFFACTSVVLAALVVFNLEKYLNFERGVYQPFTGFFGFLFGVVASLMGIGAASLSVPYMTICRVDIRRAIGTASALGLTVSIPAAVVFIVSGWGEALRPPMSLGYINIPAWAIITLAAVLSAPLGARVAHSIPVTLVRNYFAVFMVVVAVKMIVSVL